MSETHEEPHAAAEPHAEEQGQGGDAGDHALPDDGHGGGDDAHGHDGPGLGPIGWAMWGAGILGIAVAVVMTAAFVYATGFTFGA